jgi:hypothetical protein
MMMIHLNMQLLAVLLILHAAAFSSTSAHPGLSVTAPRQRSLLDALDGDATQAPTVSSSDGESCKHRCRCVHAHCFLVLEASPAACMPGLPTCIRGQAKTPCWVHMHAPIRPMHCELRVLHPTSHPRPEWPVVA